MKIAIVTGSHRQNGESTRVGHYLEQQVKAAGHEAVFFDLSQMDLPFWDEGMWGVEGLKDKWAKLWAPHAKALQECEAIVAVTPEYHGMVSSRMKNFLLLCSPAEVGHRAGMIVGVSSGVGGAYPVAELRAHAVKNNRLVWTPEHVIVRDAANMLGAEVKGEHDQNLRDRIGFALEVLYQYAGALTALRTGGKLMDKRFPFGM